MKMNKNEAKGFTLLELLIVIAILAILSVTLVLVLNPAESLRKSRDTQRMSDLATLKTALGLYLTTVGGVNGPFLTGANNDRCIGGAGVDTVFYSTTLDTDTTVAGALAAVGSIDTTTAGSGWLPVNLGNIAGGSPISNLPLDPANTLINSSGVAGTTASTAGAITNDALVYRYACSTTNLTFEINAKLESTAFGTAGEDDKGAKDGGDNTRLYEVGTAVNILPSSDDL
jgi:prepilin-type N-terminal cleavage/methylation domain-containing protein